MKKGRKDPSQYAQRRMFLFNDGVLYVQVLEDKYAACIAALLRKPAKY